ncbi:MAG: hypothetical protein LBL62_10880 [Planctomycetaceae bacterium]|jgi:hypothetical protein|nr:hypothetical protein [Planctomycetaceae bacterium]
MKHLLTSVLFSLCLLNLFLISGCNREPQKPPELPDLIADVQISVIQDGKPLEGASVTLIPLDAALTRWPIKGKTNTNGIAKLTTYGKFSGSPAGKFKVVVVKREYLPNKQQTTPEGSVFQGEWKEDLDYIDYVDPSLGLAEKTTIEIEISRDSSKHTVDIGKSVRLESKTKSNK